METLPSWISLLPWGLSALALLPFAWNSAADKHLGIGLLNLLAALLLATTGSLCAKILQSPRIRLAGILAFGLLSASFMLGVGLMWLELTPVTRTTLDFLRGGLAVLAALLALATIQILPYRPIDTLVPLKEPRYLDTKTGVMNRRALEALSDSLETSAKRHSLILLMLELPALPTQPISTMLRVPDLAFRMDKNRFLIILQHTHPGDARSVRERLVRHLAPTHLSVVEFREGDLRPALTQLQADLGASQTHRS